MFAPSQPRNREVAVSLPGASYLEPSADATRAELAHPSSPRAQHLRTARRCILGAGTLVAFAIPISAHAATAAHASHKAPSHGAPTSRRHQTATMEAAADVTYIAVGAGTPVPANTSDDYDNAQALYASPQPAAAPAATDASGATAQNPPLIDGYLLINQGS